MSNTQKSYDEVAEEYVERIFNELEHKPLDRQLLSRFVEELQGEGLVCEMGCGPGQVARFLHERGARVCGLDLSPRMVEQARQLNPEIDFQQGDMLALELADETFDGVVAFYAIVNLPRQKVVTALREFHRVLKPEGRLLIAFHIGREELHMDEWWGKQVSVDFYFFETEEMKTYLQTAGFTVEETIEREPYETVEHPSRRAYIFARRSL
jgi:ubiquinone/menaquinone biosynthesis C-methylase UbiE